MIEQQAEPKVIMRGRVYLYRQKAPFVHSGQSVLGAIEYDEAADRVKCHECGKWFQYLGAHIGPKHGMSAREYKLKHVLLMKTALLAERLRARMIEAALAIPRVYHGQRPPLLIGPRPARARMQMEQRNEAGRCPAQILKDVQTVADTIGRTPTAEDLANSPLKVHARSAMVALNVPNMGALMSLAGLAKRKKQPNKHPKYPPPILIEILRDFYVMHQRIPACSDHRRGILPDHKTFVRAFGSRRKALIAAGLPVDGVAA
jgi:ROS/MUCR transcriptional regulator protein